MWSFLVHVKRFLSLSYSQQRLIICCCALLIKDSCYLFLPLVLILNHVAMTSQYKGELVKVVDDLKSVCFEHGSFILKTFSASSYYYLC